ncbi:MAG TPA: lysophospholipid acyltransferase family protein [Arachnia sp.]|nr:lysophospholipid acyltransferase family protein [Arachnia sp.]HMT85465.1 lysophospholipid acyltransferase family protein [Arachnia sp.]
MPTAYQIFKYTIFRPLVKYGFKARVEGVENVPRSGGAILVSNHIAAMDSIVIPAMVPRPMTYPAKAELFSGNNLGTRIVAWFLKTIKMVPMDRSGGRASADALQAISDVLEEGRVVAIYPEGTRSPDGRLYKGKTGMARIALKNGVPILPVGVVGTESVKGLFGIPWVRRPVVAIGAPLEFPEYAGMTNTKVLRYVTEETMASIQRLTGQVYVDVYAARVKHGDLADGGADAFINPRPGTGVRPQV